MLRSRTAISFQARACSLAVQGADVGGERRRPPAPSPRPPARPPALPFSSRFQETQCSTAAAGGAAVVAEPGSVPPPLAGEERLEGGLQAVALRAITGAMTRATSSRMAGTERKLSTSDITSPPAASTRSTKPS